MDDTGYCGENGVSFAWGARHRVPLIGHAPAPLRGSLGRQGRLEPWSSVTAPQCCGLPDRKEGGNVLKPFGKAGAAFVHYA